MKQESIYVGIDVSKSRLDVGIRPSGNGWSLAYDDAGIRDLASRLQSLGPAAVLLEATGGLEVPLVGALAAASLPVVVINPRQVRDFAKATGRLAKTDSLDAAVLAHFAEAVRPPLRPLRDAETQVLNSLVACRQQVMTMLIAEGNRLSSAVMAVRPSIEAHIAWLKQELDDLDKGMRQTLRQSPVWREKDNLLRSVPGVGEQLSLTLLAHLPEADRRPGGRGSHQPGQRTNAGQAVRLGWPGPSEGRPLHGSVGRQPVQSGAPKLISTASDGRQAQEGRPHCLYAQAAHDPQCYGEERSILESSGRHTLTPKTVAFSGSWHSYHVR